MEEAPDASLVAKQPSIPRTIISTHRLSIPRWSLNNVAATHSSANRSIWSTWASESQPLLTARSVNDPKRFGSLTNSLRKSPPGPKQSTGTRLWPRPRTSFRPVLCFQSQLNTALSPCKPASNTRICPRSLSTDRIPNLELTQLNIRYLIDNHLHKTTPNDPNLCIPGAFIHILVAQHERSNVSPRRRTNPESSSIVTTPRSVPASNLQPSIN